MDRKEISEEKVYDNYEKGFNGRMPIQDIPEEQHKVTYPHPSKKGETTSQNYIQYEDLAVVVFVRRNEKNEFEFGLMEKEAPAFIYDEKDKKTAEGYQGIFLEAPSFPLPEKDATPENMSLWVEEQILKMGLEMQGFADLDSSKTAICQSFTNQNARFYVAGIKEGEQDQENKLHWFPMSMLESYLNLQRMGGKANLHSSVQTLYPLEQLRIKYLTQIRDMEAAEFELDRPLPELKLIDKKVTNPGYRFSVVEASYVNTANQEEVRQASYLTSRSNAGNMILMTRDEKSIFLAPQQRSPYLTIGEEIKLEVAGGLTEGKTYEKTAIAELSEEQGFEADAVKEFTGPLAATPLNSELSKAFLTYYETGKEGQQHLDEQEKIGQKTALRFEQLRNNVKDERLPLTTKYYIMLKSRDLEKEKEKKTEEIEK